MSDRLPPDKPTEEELLAMPKVSNLRIDRKRKCVWLDKDGPFEVALEDLRLAIAMMEQNPSAG